MAWAAGFAVDYSQLNRAQTRLQSAADSAALAGLIKYQSSHDANAAANVATAAFRAAGADNLASAVLTVNVDTVNSGLSVNASIVVSTPVMGILSPASAQQTVTARSNALSQVRGLGKNLEVALMLDVTISMNQSSGTRNVTKLQAMQTAAKALIDTVVQASQTPRTSRVALAPFSSAVNVGALFRTINGSAPSGSWTSVVERASPFAVNDDPPSSATFPAFRTMKNSALGSYSSYVRNLSSNVPATSIVTPLSADKTVLNNAIDAYTASGTTAGQLGIAWSWYLLSPRWTSVFTGASAPGPADANTMKVAVLMSDFDFNTYYQASAGDMNAQSAALCTAMKAAGITVYTIGFQVDPANATAMNLFTSCASDASKALSANNGAELVAVYQNLANTVVAAASSPVRLAK